MNQEITPGPVTYHVMLVRKRQDNQDIETSHIWMDFWHEQELRNWVDELRPFLKSETGIVVTILGSIKPIIREEHGAADMHARKELERLA